MTCVILIVASGNCVVMQTLSCSVNIAETRVDYACWLVQLSFAKPFKKHNAHTRMLKNAMVGIGVRVSSVAVIISYSNPFTSEVHVKWHFFWRHFFRVYWAQNKSSAHQLIRCFETSFLHSWWKKCIIRQNIGFTFLQTLAQYGNVGAAFVS